MQTLSWISSVLSGTTVAGRLSELLRTYFEADAAMDSWKRKSLLSCADGCGSCCERFMPDLLPVEADLIALYLCADRPDLLNGSLTTGRVSCPLYCAETAEHCPIYPVRPLVCRLFGFSASSGKNGQSVFSLCRFMEGGDKRSYTEPEAVAAFGSLPPSMGDFGFRVQSIDSAADRSPLPEALEASLRKIRYLLSLRNPDDPDKGGPEILSA